MPHRINSKHGLTIIEFNINENRVSSNYDTLFFLGVWERYYENKRLHFHGIFYISEGTMPGELIKVNEHIEEKISILLKLCC